MSNNTSASLGLKITKTVAVSSLGLYAGLLQSSSIVSIYSPMDSIKSALTSIYCKLGQLGSAQGTITTAAFAIACYLAKDADSSEKKALLYGLLAAPISGAYLWATSKAVKFFAQMGKNKDGDDAEIELPPNHPSIYNEKGERLHCPFGEEAEKNSKSSIKKIIPMKYMTRVSPVFQSMGLHLFIASAIATYSLSYNICLH